MHSWSTHVFCQGRRHEEWNNHQTKQGEKWKAPTAKKNGEGEKNKRFTRAGGVAKTEARACKQKQPNRRTKKHSEREQVEGGGKRMNSTWMRI
jgi:hypothetical protein